MKKEIFKLDVELDRIFSEMENCLEDKDDLKIMVEVIQRRVVDLIETVIEKEYASKNLSIK